MGANRDMAGGDGANNFAEMIRKLSASGNGSTPLSDRAPSDGGGGGGLANILSVLGGERSDRMSTLFNNQQEAFQDRVQPVMAGLQDRMPDAIANFRSRADEFMEANPFGMDPRTGLNRYGGRGDPGQTMRPTDAPTHEEANAFMEANPYGMDPRSGLNKYGGRGDPGNTMPAGRNTSQQSDPNSSRWYPGKQAGIGR